jgi:hypothetical protein
MLSIIALLTAIAVRGDSIAEGTGHALGVPTFAHSGSGSCWIAEHSPELFKVNVDVISAGINDPPGECLELIRRRVHARIVIWILPAPINSARAHVLEVARAHGDLTVSYRCDGACTPFNFHPASYEALADDIRALLKSKP